MLIRSQNVYDDGLRLDDVARFDYSLFEKRGSHVLPNDLLLNITGASIGRCAIVPREFEVADVNQHVLILRQIDLASLAFVHLVITSPVVQAAIMNVQVGATKEGLSATRASELLIPMAPIQEQQRIIDCVNALLGHVADYGALEDARERLDVELPDKLRKSVLQLAVQGRLAEQDPADEPASALLDRIRAERAALVKAKKLKIPRGGESIIYRSSDGGYYEKHGKGEPVCIEDEIPFDIPDSWEWARIRDFGFFSSGKTPSKHDQSLYGGDHLWVTSKDMKSFKISQTGISLSDKGAAGLNTYPVGTMLFVVRSGILKRFLPIAILDKPATINQDIKALTLYFPPIAVGLAYFIKAFEPYILEELTKSVTTVDSLRFDEFQSMLIPVPPQSEWDRIIGQLDIALGNVITNQ